MIHVKELPFEPIPASEAETLLKGGDPAYTYVHAETLAKQIENGKAGRCEVAVAGMWLQKEKESIWDMSGREAENYEMAILLTKDRSRLCAEGVLVPADMEIQYGSLTEEDVYYLIPPRSGGLHQRKNRHFWRFFRGGGGWIRTTEVTDNRFTVCPLWPLGNSSIFIFYRSSVHSERKPAKRLCEEKDEQRSERNAEPARR